MLFRVDRIEFQPLTIDCITFMEVYRRKRSDSAPSLVYGVKMCGHSRNY